MRRRCRRGFALADFVCGSLIFSAVILAFANLTSSKLRLLDAGEARLIALAAAEEQVDAVRAKGMPAEPRGEADAEGFRQVATFEPRGRLIAANGRVEARALRLMGGAAHGLFEVRVVVTWRDVSGEGRLALSTVSPPAAETR